MRPVPAIASGRRIGHQGRRQMTTMDLDDAMARNPGRDSGARPASGRIALFLPSLAGGGAEASMVRIAEAMVRRGLQVDLALCERKGPLLDQVPPEVQIIELGAAPMLVARARALAGDPAGLLRLLQPVLLAGSHPTGYHICPRWRAICAGSGPTRCWQRCRCQTCSRSGHAGSLPCRPEL